MGITIKDAPLVEQLSGCEKIPISDGSNEPRTVNVEQIKEFANKDIEIPTKVSELDNDSGYATSKEVEDAISKIHTPDVGGQISAALVDYVKKVEGKGLSTNDFTDDLKAKLEGITPYDPSELEAEIGKLETALNTLVSGNTSDAIESFNEVIAFLDGISDSKNLDSIIASIEQQIESKYSKPSSGIPKADLSSDVQSSLNKANTAIQEHQDISHLATKNELEQKQDVLVSSQNIKTINGKSILGSGNIFIEANGNGSADLTGYATEDWVKDEIKGKQDTITDLEDIREGSALGMTALQEEQFKGTISAVDTNESVDEPEMDNSINVLDNGNIKVTINGVSKDFMPATPSGDPMHHYYKSLGAQWNDGENKTLQIPIYGKDKATIEYFPVVHKSKRWYFNLLGDITNAQMAEIVSYPRNLSTENSYNGCKARTVIFEGNGVSSPVSYKNFCVRANIESLYVKQAIYPSDVTKMFYVASFFRYMLGNPSNNGYIIGYYGFGTSNGASPDLVEIRIYSLKRNALFPNSSNLSKTSILFMVNEANPTTAIVITLHATAYARVANDEEVIAALEAKNAALQGTGGSVSIVSA